MNHILSIAESPDTHCAISGPSNLVFSLAAPDVEISLAQSPTSSNPQSRNQRCFRYRDCFDGGSQPFMCGSRGLMDRLTRARRATFKAVSLSSRVDRSQLRQDGSLNKYQPGSQNLMDCSSEVELGSFGPETRRRVKVVQLPNRKVCGTQISCLGTAEVRIFLIQPIWQKPRRVPLGLNDDSGGHKALLGVPVRTKVKPRLRKRTRELTQQYCPIRPKAPRYA